MREKKFFHSRVEALTRKELDALQFRRFKWQLQRCYRGSPFYRERLKAAGLHPDDIQRMRDVSKIPPLRKQDLLIEQDKHPPFGRFAVAATSRWREVHPSTGTTGTPINTIWTQSDVENIAEVTARTLWSFGVRPADVIQNAFSYGLWVAGLAAHYAASRLGCLVIPIGATSTERQVDYLIRAKPTVLLSTPSFALYLAEKLKEKGISPGHLSLRLGGFGGEPGAEVPSTRKRLEEGLGVDAYDYYGLAEIGPTMASECTEKAGLHWSEDHHLIEVLDPKTGEPVAPGEVGVLTITHLTREATPMIRYWTNDLARLEREKCGCGRTHARSPGGILGRLDDMIVYRGAKFYPTQVEKVVRGFPELGEEFRILLERDPQTGIESFTVVVECASGEKREVLEGELKSALKEELQVTPSIRFVEPGTLDRTLFKAKRVVDKRLSGPAS